MHEVDFILKKKNSILECIQVTHASNRYDIENREVKSLLKARNELQCKNLKMITYDYESEDNDIQYIPLWKWLLYESPTIIMENRYAKNIWIDAVIVGDKNNIEIEFISGNKAIEVKYRSVSPKDDFTTFKKMGIRGVNQKLILSMNNVKTIGMDTIPLWKFAHESVSLW